MPAGASEDFLFCAIEIDSLLLLLLLLLTTFIVFFLAALSGRIKMYLYIGSYASLIVVFKEPVIGSYQ